MLFLILFLVGIICFVLGGVSGIFYVVGRLVETDPSATSRLIETWKHNLKK